MSTLYNDHLGIWKRASPYPWHYSPSLPALIVHTHVIMFRFHSIWILPSPVFNWNLINIFWSLKSIFLITISLPLKAFLPLIISTKYSQVFLFLFFSFHRLFYCGKTLAIFAKVSFYLSSFFIFLSSNIICSRYYLLALGRKV